jgi:hypothetical protein
MANKYYKSNYTMKAQETNEVIAVNKSSNSDWCEITMATNDKANGAITIKSKHMAEQLHFMLGQMLRGEE